MHTDTNVTKIVFLDRDGLPERIQIARPIRPHEWVEYGTTDAASVAKRLESADIAVTNKVPIDGNILALCPNLKHIAVTATGYNIVDIDACKKNNVSVSNVPSYAASTVSEHVIASSLMLRREIPRYTNSVQNGDWQKSSMFCLFGKPFSNLSGSTLGLIGMGEIGKATAQKAHALGMNVQFCARRELDPNQAPYANQVQLNELLQSSDILSIHCDLNDSTLGMIGSEQISLMKQGAILINTARGGIVNEKAAVKAIQDHHLGGLAFDVLETEPPSEASPLLSISHLPNVLITPHIAWASEQAMQHLADTVGKNIQAFLDGNPTNVVTNNIATTI